MYKLNQKLIQITQWLEILTAILVLIATIIALINVAMHSFDEIMHQAFELETFMSYVLSIVVGVEFIKMLLLHTPESIIEVLLYTVARQIILSHDSALENLIGVSAVAIIFIVRKYLLKASKTDVLEHQES